MFDSIVDKINRTWVLLFCLFPFIIIGFCLGNMIVLVTLCIIWSVPVSLYVIDTFGSSSFSIERKIGYNISRGTMYLLAIQYSILTIALLEYHIVNIVNVLHSSWWTISIAVLVLSLYIAMNCYIIKGFLLSKYDDGKDVLMPIYRNEDLTKESKCVFEAAINYSTIVSKQQEEIKNLENIQIPVPEEPSDNNKTPFVNYLKNLSNVPKSHAEFATLEQFILSVADKSGFYDFGDNIIHNLDEMLHDGVSYAAGLKDIVIDAKSSFADYISHHDHDTTYKLLSNIKKCITSDVHSPKFKFDIAHSHGEYGHFSTVIKHVTKDIGKGGAETFFDSDQLDNLNEDFAEHFSQHIDDIANSIPTSVDIDVWDSDFDCDAHFPLITTAIEVFKLGSKSLDDDVDMGSAIGKSINKIGLTAGGAYLGGVLGTLVFPGIGTLVGSMIGGWLGKKGAHSINTAELKRLQNELSEQIEILQQAAKEAQNNIEQYQKETTLNISSIAKDKNIVFEDIKKDNPFEEYSQNTMLIAVSIIIRDYLKHIIKNCEDDPNITSNQIQQLRQYIPSNAQINRYPQESLGLLLSSQKYIKNNINEDYRYNSELMNEICLKTIVKSITILKSLQALWYNKIFVEYKDSIYSIMKESNEHIKEYVENVDKEKKRIDEELDKVERIKKEVENEAKTL